MIFLYIALCIASAIFWRMGGAAGFDKLWRRLGSSACILLCILLSAIDPINWRFIITIAMVLWGSWSYFGWLTPGNKDEQWFNFLAAALLTQLSLVAMHFDFTRLLVGVSVACLATLGKVLIDNSKLKSRDVLSELFYGFAMCAGVII